MLQHDLRHALRWLRANPGFTSAALLVLALGIGAATATFTVLHAVVLRPLPFHEPDRIIRIWSSASGRNLPFFSVTAADALEWAARATTLSVVAPYDRQRDDTLRGRGSPELVTTARVSRQLFELFGVAPSRGRWFNGEEDRAGSQARVAVISHGLWQRLFGGRADAVGQTLQLDDGRWTVIGIMPPSFAIPNTPAEILMPLQLAPDPARLGGHYLRVLGRLRDGVTIQDAESELIGIAAALGREYPASNASWTVTVRPLVETVVSTNVRRALLTVAGAVGLVLLIACANVASLLLTRATTRAREMAVRSALGASRAALVRQLLIESLTVAVGGGALGVLLAMWTLDALGALALTTIPRADEIALRPVVLIFAVVVTTISAVVAGAVPALSATRINVEALRTRDVEAGRGTSRARDVLVVAEIALAMMLLVAAGLMTQSFIKLQRRDLGFEPDRLLMVQLTPAPEPPPAAFYDALVARLSALPGVVSVAGGSSLPFAGPNSANVLAIEGREFAPDERPDADFRVVTPDYFSTLGIPLLRGRPFTHGASDASSVVVNATLARRFLEGDPIGRRIRVGDSSWLTVVGIAGDARYLGLDDPGNEVRPMMYLPYAVRPRELTMALRTSTPPETLAATVRAAVASAAPGQPIARLETMDEVLATTRGPQRFNAAVLSAFAWIALVLAAAGLWGLIAHGVSRRTHEIGVRVALGARPSEVLRMIAGRGVWLALIGIGCGLAGSAAATGVLQRVLFNTPPADLATFTVIAAVFLAVAVAASVLPARRALRIDPVQALRSE